MKMNHLASRPRTSRQRGFSLIEAMMVVSIMGVLSVLMAPMMGELFAARKLAMQDQERQINAAIAASFLQFARTESPFGRLPEPYSHAGSGFILAPWDPSDAALASLFQERGLKTDNINTDGRAIRGIRVYQRLEDLVEEVPIAGITGPTVELLYDFGVIYSTMCSSTGGTGCNEAPIPADSEALTEANRSTWKTAGEDFGEAFVSSLPVQRERLNLTIQNMDQVRDAFREFVRSAQLASPADPSNFLPNSTSSPASTLGAPGSPGRIAGQGCTVSWISLSSSDVLEKIGMTPEISGETAWGGALEYCRDYDATGTQATGDVPHHGAIRFNRFVSEGLDPDAVTATNNIVLPL